MPEEKAKLEELKNTLRRLESVVTAYSGGVDSSFLLKTALDVLGPEKTLAATASSPSYPASELKSAEKLAETLGAEFILIKTDELSNPEYRPNPGNRCYFCKKELFKKLEEIRKNRGFKHVIEGSNLDDDADYRPGSRAAAEAGVISPLREARLTKEEIRNLSKKAGLPTWDKPALACLASRIPYGEKITEEKLRKIDMAESFLRSNGVRDVRVRHHGNIARIEAGGESMRLMIEPEFRAKTARRLKKLGFSYVTLDIEGYRTGSMNEELENHEKNIP